MGLFRRDDFEEINSRFFSEMRQNKSYTADPSGWLHKILHINHLLPEPLASLDGLTRYCSDEEWNIKGVKENYVEFASRWDENSYSYDNLSLCSSVTSAIAIVLATLKRKGVKCVFFETPLYFAALCQARIFGLRTVLLPTYIDNDFVLDRFEAKISKKGGPFAFWISQPRTYLGVNQEPEYIQSIINTISNKSYLIVDEAMEQEWPSRMQSVSPTQSNVIKLRSITKGIGLNGLRMAYILHPQSIRAEIVSSMENFQGGLDSQSVRLTSALITNEDLYKRLLRSSRDLIFDLSRLARAEILGTGMILSKIQNGYIGSVALPRPASMKTISVWRKRLLSHCVINRCPIILGSSMYFAVDKNFEFVRLTYFNGANHLRNGLRILASIYRGEGFQ